ncbi:hypothetical protein [Cupriavidus sp. D39]|nr:hypothetical protein [Cupriavidus sp. D39]
MTPFGYFVDRSTRQLAEAAVSEALADASIEGADVGFVAYSNAAGG